MNKTQLLLLYLLFPSGGDNLLSQNTGGRLKARHKTMLNNVPGAQGMGRDFASNLFLELPGPPPYCHRVLQVL